MTTEADRRKLQTFLARPLADLESELELYDAASRGPADVWNKIAGPLRQRICVEWDYCAVRQDARWADDLDLAIIILGKLTEKALNLPIPVDLMTVTAILVKRGLDKFCGCA